MCIGGNFSTTKGTIQGGTISPTLANLTLDGLKYEIAKLAHTLSKGAETRII
jgi:retron-type reverse transcriptase